MRRTSQIKKRAVPVNCYFCNTHTEPDYKDVAILGRYLTERGKIIGRSKTGICSWHQRHLTRAIKRARLVAFIPFVTRT